MVKFVKIPFLSQFEKPLRDGDKTCTFRRKKYGEEGDYFKIFGMTFQLLGYEETTLMIVREKYWQQEGVGSKEEFDEIWCKIHPRMGVNPSFKGWLHFFVRVYE